jgi:hypothetical protein
MQSKQDQFVGENTFLKYEVIKWRHNVKILADLVSTHQGLLIEVLHYVVPSISKFDLGVSDF